MTPTALIRRILPHGDGHAVLLAVAVAALVAAGPSLAAAPQSHPGASTSSALPGNPGGQGNGNGNGKPVTTPTPGHGAPASGSAQGIVQSVDAGSVVLTQLDGSSVSVAVTQNTRVFVDGRHASVRDVKPGFVASAAWFAGKTRVLQAFDPSPAGAVEVGVVRSVSVRVIVVRKSDGSTARVRIGPHTRVLIDGNPAALRAVTAGFTVVFAAGDAKTGKPAGELRFLRPI